MISISIIIPVYNVAEFILKCLESVASQSYTSDVECLVIDDCGTDHSIEIAKNYINAYSGPIKFKIIHHEKNKGLSGARNTGIAESSGTYLYFLDSDDYVTIDCLESFVKLIQKYNKPEFVIGGSIATKGFPYFNLEKRPELPEYSENYNFIKRTMLHRSMLPMTAWNKMIRKDFLENNNLFFKEGIIHEDEFWNIMVLHSLHNLVINKHNTYIYNIRNNSIITNKNSEKSISSWLQIWDLAIRSNKEPQMQYHLMITWMTMINSSKLGLIPENHQFQYLELLHSLQSKMSLLNKVYSKTMGLIPKSIYSNKLCQKCIRHLNNFFVYRMN